MTFKEEWQHQMKMLEGKSAKDKIMWFIDYYKIHVIIIVALTALIISIVSTALTSKEQKAGVIFLNAESDMVYEDTTEEIDQPLAEYIGLNTEKESVLVDASEYMTPGTTAADTYKYSTQQKVMVEIAAGGIDVICADAWNFCNYASQQTFQDLRDVLTHEQIEKYQDKFYYIDQDLIDARADTDVSEADNLPPTGTIADITDSDEAIALESVEEFELPDPDTMGNPVPIGIVFTDSPYFKETGMYTSAVPIVGALVSQEDHDYASKMIDWFWEH